MGVFDKDAQNGELPSAPEETTNATEAAPEADPVPTDEEILAMEAEVAEAEKKKADAERVAKMNAAKAAKKAAETPLPPSEHEKVAVSTTPKVVARVRLSPAELAELNNETGVKPTKEDIKNDKDMRDYLMSFPLVNVVIPLTAGERPGTTETVSINGVTLTIRKGSMVAIPKPFAEQVMNFTNIQMENGTVGGEFAIAPGSSKADKLS